MISMQQQQMQREIETITFLQVSLVIELRTWNNIELNFGLFWRGCDGKFLQHLFTESKEFNAIMKINMPMKNLTPEQKQSYIFNRNPLFMSTEVDGEQSQMQASQLFEWRVHRSRF
jgi:hypothetical protein